jgi:nucleotide-binding universal stress UspA family protein
MLDEYVMPAYQARSSAMKILVPLDGSQTAEATIPVALRLVRDPKTSLVLLAVATVRPDQEPARAGEELAPIREARAYLNCARDHLLHATEGVERTVWSGPPAAAIIKAAQTHGADMIVMTTHGRSGREREMFGSMADAVLRGAPMPVLVLRPRRETIRPAATTTATAANA